MHTHFAQLISSPYIDLAFVNTISQNHITSDGIPGRDQIDNPALNTMGQYHGKVPWFYKFRAQLGIHDLSCSFPRTYANPRMHSNMSYSS